MMRDEVSIAAMQMVLLFHSGGPWTHEREIEWINCIRTIEKQTGQPISNRPEVTTRILCDAIRVAMGAVGRVNG